MSGYFPESALAHRYIDPLQPGPGLEIGGSAHNPWGIPHTVNVDCTSDRDTVFKCEEIHLCGRTLAVDVVAQGDRLPFADGSYHWLLNSHVFEHLPNPIGALLEWWRVLALGGIIVSHLPKRDAHPGDRGRQVSTLAELVHDFATRQTLDSHPITGGCECRGGHYHVWDVPLYLAMIGWVNRLLPYLDVLDLLETDDKVGNSHAFVLRVVKPPWRTLSIPAASPEDHDDGAGTTAGGSGT